MKLSLLRRAAERLRHYDDYSFAFEEYEGIVRLGIMTMSSNKKEISETNGTFPVSFGHKARMPVVFNVELSVC